MNIKQSKGFTLIELLVVIAIIGLLSSVVLASLSTARAKARDARRMADVKNIKLALELYFDASSSYPVPPSATLDGYGWIQSAPSSGWNWFKNELNPYIQGTPTDPVNTYPFSYYYRTLAYASGQDPLCKITPTLEGDTYLIVFSTETQTFNLPKWSTGEAGSKERYCIRP